MAENSIKDAKPHAGDPQESSSPATTDSKEKAVRVWCDGWWVENCFKDEKFNTVSSFSFIEEFQPFILKIAIQPINQSISLSIVR
jgi:hypothetical protein